MSSGYSTPAPGGNSTPDTTMAARGQELFNDPSDVNDLTKFSEVMVTFNIRSPILERAKAEDTIHVALGDLMKDLDRARPAFVQQWKQKFIYPEMLDLLIKFVDMHGLDEELKERIQQLIAEPDSLQFVAKRYVPNNRLYHIPKEHRNNLKYLLVGQLTRTTSIFHNWEDETVDCDVQICGKLGRLLAGAYNATYPFQHLEEMREQVSVETDRVRARIRSSSSGSSKGSTPPTQIRGPRSQARPMRETMEPIPYPGYEAPHPQDIRDREQSERFIEESGHLSHPRAHETASFRQSMGLTPISGPQVILQHSRAPPTYHSGTVPMSFRPTMSRTMPFDPPRQNSRFSDRYSAGEGRPSVSSYFRSNIHSPHMEPPQEERVPASRSDEVGDEEDEFEPSGHPMGEPVATTGMRSRGAAPSIAPTTGPSYHRDSYDSRDVPRSAPPTHPSAGPHGIGSAFHHPPAGTPGGPSDPPWDSSRRDGFAYPRSTEAIHCHRRHPMPVEGTHWWSFRVDPNSFEVHCDVDTGTIAPWFAERPGHGRVLNHPVCLHMQHQDRNQFLSHFRFRGEFDSKMIRDFQNGFPACPDNATLSSLLSYHSTVVKYATSYKVFVPPAHTLCSNNFLGTWYDDLNDHYKGHVSQVFPQLLSRSLLGKQANLTKQPNFGSLLSSDLNGYHILYHLAMLGGHPRLCQRPSNPKAPVQTESTPLTEYTKQWVHYINLVSLSGEHFSDRYYIAEFIQAMHPALGILITHLRHSITPFESASAVQDPVPEFFYPEKIITWFTEYALSIDKLHLVNSSPLAIRAKARPPRPSVVKNPPARRVHAVSHRPASSDMVNTADPLSPEEAEAWHVHALNAMPRGCYWCQSDTHRLFDCPRAKGALQDPHKRNLIRKMLDSLPSDPSKSSSKAVKQLQEDGLEAGEGDYGDDLDLPDDSDPDSADFH